MPSIRGFELPDDLYYVVEKHVWVRPVQDEIVRLGLTPVAYTLLRNSIVAISVKSGMIHKQVAKGKSVAMVESLKYIGPLSAPLDGVLLRGNDRLALDPDLAAADPYGEGWIVEMQPNNWEEARKDLATGAAALQAYEALLEAQDINQD